MEITLVAAVVAVAGIALFVWWLVALLDALRMQSSVWDAAGQSQLVYVLLMIFLGVVGTLAYVLVARPRLRAATSASLTG